MAEYGRLQQLKDRPAVTWSNIGFFGFFAGPQVYVIDRFAISNPILARLPITTNSIDAITGTHWRIGHFPRELPDGYIESLESGENRINDQEISELYDKLQLITRGNLLDRDRLKAIWRMNTGRWGLWIQTLTSRTIIAEDLVRKQLIVTHLSGSIMGVSMLSWLELADDFLNMAIISPARLPGASATGLRNTATLGQLGITGYSST